MNRSPKHVPGFDKSFLDVEVHCNSMMKIFTKISRTLTLPADTGPKVVTELKWVLDGDAGRDPHLLELAEVLALSDAHHQLLVVPFPGEEVQKVDPELANSHLVLPPARPLLVDPQLLTEPGIPAVNLQRRYSVWAKSEG